MSYSEDERTTEDRDRCMGGLGVVKEKPFTVNF
jgi:hypothetical protein